MAIFHQSSHQLNTQIKVFPVRLNELHIFNVSFDDANEYQFADYGETFGGFSFVAFLPVVVIGVLLAILVIFLKLRSLRTDRDQLERMENVYRVLEYVDQMASNPYEDADMVQTIQSILLPDDEDSEQALLQPRKNSFFYNEYHCKLQSESFCELDANSQPQIRVAVDLEHTNQIV
ncbi:hypothetical protein M3Y94_00242300 [Aphelenchoides besseyi]|nr:hypothetical protein M3Y94_00242300 [Aphelenchoides besseyi]KAI6236337.1 hypothetical protein M3Y95_00146700 [Aphelenchoides besseyi]